jgi:hypothetical protein
MEGERIQCPTLIEVSITIIFGGSRPTAGCHFPHCLYLSLPQSFDYRLTSSMYMFLAPVHFYLYCLCTVWCQLACAHTQIGVVRELP